MDLQAVLGLSYCFSFLRRESFPFTILRSATVDNVHPVLRLYVRFGLGCIRFFDRRVDIEEVCFVHVCIGAICGVPTHYVVPDLLDTLSIQRLNPKNRESWDSRSAIVVLYDVTTGVRLLKRGDLHVVS